MSVQWWGTCRCNNSRAFGCTESSPRNAGESGGGQDGHCVHVWGTADASLYCTYPKVKNLQSRSNTAKSSSFYATKVSIKGESSCQNSKTCAVQGRSLNHHHHHHSSFKSPLARPGWARFQEPKRPEPSFARRAQARKMKVSDRSDRSRMAGSTLPSELSSRQAEQGILEGPHEEDTRHPILHDTIIYLEILV